MDRRKHGWMYTWMDARMEHVWMDGLKSCLLQFCLGGGLRILGFKD